MKRISKIIISLLVALSWIMLTPSPQINAARVYQITFRAGAHGTFLANDSNKITYSIASNEKFPDVPDIKVADGYYFIGWDKVLPKRNDLVAKAMTFVAKYQVLTDGREYSINYVNQNNIQIATSLTMMAPLGATVNQRAKTIAGHELIGNSDLQIVIGEKDNSITYIYRDLNVSEEYAESVVVVPVYLPANVAVSTTRTPDGTTGNTTTNGGTTGEQESETIKEPKTPQSSGGEVIENSKTPQVKGANYTYLLGVGGIVLIIIAVILLLLKKKSKVE